MPSSDSAINDAERIKRLALAFDYVQRELRKQDHLILMDDVLAKRIVALAESGEVDPEKLCDEILGEHGIRRADAPADPKDHQANPSAGD